MNKVRTLGILNNILLECQDQGHLDNDSLNTIMKCLTSNWSEID